MQKCSKNMELTAFDHICIYICIKSRRKSTGYYVNAQPDGKKPWRKWFFELSFYLYSLQFEERILPVI